MGDHSDKHFPFEFQKLNPEEKNELSKAYKTPYATDYVRVGPKGYFVFRRYMEEAANIYNMPLRPSDIFVASYQRSGTTWTQELVWLLASKFDYATAESIPLTERFAFLDMFMFFQEKYMDEYLNLYNNGTNEDGVKKFLEIVSTPASRMLANAPSPRFIKTHLPMSLLPPAILDTAKVVYVARDPRDVAVSSFHHSKLFKIASIEGNFKDFWKLFRKDLFTLTPYFEHLKDAWEKRDHPNMLFLFYEELSKDLPATVRRVTEFLGKEVTAEQMSRLCEHLEFDNFKNNKSVNYDDARELGVLAENQTFIRRGKAGGWRDYFDEEMTKDAEQWMADNLRDTDLHFPHIEK